MLLNNFKRYLPENVGIDNKILIDIAGLVNRRINNKLAAEYKDFPLLIVAAVKSSLNLQIKEGNRPRLNAALVNRCLTERLDYGSNTYF
jgi:hypothetical protein